MIECSLQEMAQYTWGPNNTKRSRFGRCLSSSYPLKDLHKKKWLVGINVDVPNLKGHIDSDMSPEDIAVDCLEFLNTPQRTATGRRRRKPTYGRCDSMPVRAFLKTKSSGEPYLQVIAATNQRKSKMFWGNGHIR